MDVLATLTLPPSESSAYVRIAIGDQTVGYLHKTYYDAVYRSESEYEQGLAAGGERESHTKENWWVVRYRGELALKTLYEDLARRASGD